MQSVQFIQQTTTYTLIVETQQTSIRLGLETTTPPHSLFCYRGSNDAESLTFKDCTST